MVAGDFLSDWISTFLKETEGIRSAESFRLWGGIACLAGVLERRVWTATDCDPLYPNLYTVLAGTPASGKSLVINTVRNLISTIKDLKLGPDNPTKASFLDCLEDAKKPVHYNSAATRLESPLFIACREFGVMIPKHDSAFLNDLTDLYDSPKTYFAPRRTSKTVNIDRPCLNILAATTPDFLYELLPEAAWGQGFTSRLLFIYGTQTTKERDIFAKRTDVHVTILLKKLNEYYDELRGEFEWLPDARKDMNDWFNAGMKPVPNYGRLVHYAGRRDMHCLKLAMISAISSESGMVIRKQDFERGLHWLLEAEKTMPDVFRAMVQKSDKQILDDFHWHFYTIYSTTAKEKRKPTQEPQMYAYLENKVTSDKISRMIEASVKSGRFRPGPYPGEYIPQPLTGVVE